MSADPLVLAYLAGVIDSDGFISITHSTRKGSHYFGPVVGIAGTRPAPHELAASLWGGKVRAHTPKNPRHRIQFQWNRQGAAAAEVIQAIRPFLRVKGEQADLALRCFEHLLWGRSDDPYPWLSPYYDPTADLLEMRAEMVTVLNQARHLDGRTWDEYPAGAR